MAASEAAKAGAGRGCRWGLVLRLTGEGVLGDRAGGPARMHLTNSLSE